MDPDRFGIQFIITGDLDPSYFLFKGLYHADPVLAKRLVVAHMLFYHIGTSSWIVDQPNFWEAARTAASSKHWPRGRERRHFRAAFAIQIVDGLSYIFPEPANLIDFIYAPTFKYATDRAASLPGMGSYFAFKIPDIMERCLGYRIAADDSILAFNPVPALALAEFAAHSRVDPSTVLNHLQYTLGAYAAPPGYDRPVGLQEIETVLCTSREAWRKGVKSYYIGWDIKKHRANLLEPFDDPLGLLKFLPPDPPEQTQNTYFFHRRPEE